MLDAIEKLEDDNAEAWSIFQKLARRFVVDAELVAMVYQRLTAHLEADDAADMLERMCVIYDLVMPEKKPSSS